MSIDIKKVHPRGSQILVQRDEAEGNISEFGIATPDAVEKEQKAYGTVIAVGPDIKDVKKGDRVIYGVYAGEEIEVEIKGKKVSYRLLEDEFVIAFIR